MNSSNNGKNRIAPLETLETISSNLEMGDQNVSPTFSKTEQISHELDNKTDDSIHYISWLFGILLSCTALLSALIVPWHNVLKEPFYLYEHHIYAGAPWLAILVATYIMQLEYWAGIKYDKKMNLFFFLTCIFGVIYAVIALSHFYVHVYYFELFAPAPYGGLVPGHFGTYVLIAILFFRYHYT